MFYVYIYCIYIYNNIYIYIYTWGGPSDAGPYTDMIYFIWGKRQGDQDEETAKTMMMSGRPRWLYGWPLNICHRKGENDAKQSAGFCLTFWLTCW